MRTVIPDDCGNAPRVAIVADLVRNWAGREAAPMREWFTDNTSWTVAGGETHRGVAAIDVVAPSEPPEQLVLHAIATHGRLAACDGYMVFPRHRVDFSHAFRFAGASKTAKLAEVRTYLVSSNPD